MGFIYLLTKKNKMGQWSYLLFGKLSRVVLVLMIPPFDTVGTITEFAKGGGAAEVGRRSSPLIRARPPGGVSSGAGGG